MLLIDVETTRSVNMHEEILLALDLPIADAWKPLRCNYLISYQPLRKKDEIQLAWWTDNLNVGDELPLAPLWIGTDICAPVELGATYETTLHGLRVI